MLIASHPQMMPAEYEKELKWVLGDVTPRPVESIKQTIEVALGRSFEGIFKSIDHKPLGAASVGQVHRAILHDGRTVAVKVQYPEAAENFAVDFRGFRILLSMVAPHLNSSLDSLERVCLQEMVR